MTDKQEKFLKDLVTQFGYPVESKFRQDYWDYILFNRETVENASNAIDKLLQKVKVRKFLRRRKEKTTISVSDLSDFVFCPASYSLKLSFIANFEIVSGNLHPYDDNQKGFFRDYIQKYKEVRELINSKVRVGADLYYHVTRYKNYFDVFMSAKLILDSGKMSTYKPFINKKYNILGKPSLVFEKPNKKRIVVCEKFAKWPGNLPEYFHDNLKVLVCAYLFLFNDLNADEGYVIYWDMDEQADLFKKQFEVFHVTKDEYNEKIVLEQVKMVNKLHRAETVEFNISDLYFSKCVNCSYHTICNHKSGLIQNINLPYYTPNFNSRYPQHHTIAELSNNAEFFLAELSHIDSKTIEDNLIV